MMVNHARLVCEWFGDHRGILMMRKFAAWYTKSFPGGAALRAQLIRAQSLDELRAGVAGIDRDVPFPPLGMRVRRGKRGGTQSVTLPEGYLDHLDDDTPPGPEAEALVSGG